MAAFQARMASQVRLHVPPGRDGRDGRDGAKGDQGIAGNVGPQGLPGVIGPAGATGKDGAKRDLGAQGPPGQKGERGEPGNPAMMPFKNWKECAWKNVNDDRDNALIKVCVMIIYGDSVYGMLVSLTYHCPPPPNPPPLLSEKNTLLRKICINLWQVVACNIQSNHLHPENILYP